MELCCCGILFLYHVALHLFHCHLCIIGFFVRQIYERRSNVVKEKEAEKWKHVTPDMSEEEEEGDSFIRHQPSWRSDIFNHFLEKLEGRYKAKHARSLAKPRTYGEPVQKPPPASAPSWMVRQHCTDDNSANELFSDASDADLEDNTEGEVGKLAQ